MPVGGPQLDLTQMIDFKILFVALFKTKLKLIKKNQNNILFSWIIWKEYS